MYSEGDKVRIIDAADTSWIGKEGLITSVSNITGYPITYKLDIGGGDWTHSMLEKIKELTDMERQEILGLALVSAHNKLEDIQVKIKQLELQKEKFQTMIDNIRYWQDDLK